MFAHLPASPKQPLLTLLLSADYDRDIDNVPSLRTRAEREIAAEIRTASLSSSASKGPHPSLDRFPSPSTTLDDTQTHPLVSASLARLSLRDPPAPKAGEGLDTSRFALPGPKEGPAASEEEWKQAVDNAGAQLEHQRVRLANLELAGKYGANGWKTSNFLLEKEIDRVQRQVDEAKDRVVEINRRRKGMQVRFDSSSPYAVPLINHVGADRSRADAHEPGDPLDRTHLDQHPARDRQLYAGERAGGVTGTRGAVGGQATGVEVVELHCTSHMTWPLQLGFSLGLGHLCSDDPFLGLHSQEHESARVNSRKAVYARRRPLACLPAYISAR